ncbi:MAG: hypothetical protein H6Q89_2124 [Myxococcaceae bacterium]|nr:hypothetical protein [Myxococcaceae bacterium]
MRKLLVVLSLVLTPAFALAATPSEGVPLKVRRGFFTDIGIGVFHTVGGDNGYSNAQSFLQLGAGYQFGFGQNEKYAVPVALNVGIGANAANCWAGLSKAGVCSQSDNFTVTFLGGSAGFMVSIAERLYVGGKLLFGYTLLDPAPDEGFSGGVHFGAALALEYATNMDHFTIGVDVGYRGILGGSTMIHSLHYLVRVKYTF